MTRKRVGQGLVEAFSEECPTCKGRGFILHDEPTVSASYDDPYAVKGGDPFVKSTVKHHTPAKESAPSSSKGSSPDVKAKLAKIAAAAQSASEEAD
jgi:ribonuclease E